MFLIFHFIRVSLFEGVRRRRDLYFRQRDDQTRSGVLISNVKKTRQRYKLSNNLNKASSEICIYIIVLCIDIK